jgi:hypothetical protein
MIVVNLKLDTRRVFTNACNTNIKMELTSHTIPASEVTIQQIIVIPFFFLMWRVIKNKIHQ